MTVYNVVIRQMLQDSPVFLTHITLFEPFGTYMALPAGMPMPMPTAMPQAYSFVHKSGIFAF